MLPQNGGSSATKVRSTRPQCLAVHRSVWCVSRCCSGGFFWWFLPGWNVRVFLFIWFRRIDAVIGQGALEWAQRQLQRTRCNRGYTGFWSVRPSFSRDATPLQRWGHILTLVVFFLPSVTPSTIVRSPIPSYLVVARPLLSRDDISSAKSVERAFQRVLKRNTLRLRESLLRPSFLFLRNDSTYSIFPSWIYIYIRRTRR